MQLPPQLMTDDPQAAATLLQQYYGMPYRTGRYTGALFDGWDSTGTRTADQDRFSADDLVAITLLSVNAGGDAARVLLEERTAEFNQLLADIGDDRDLGDEAGPIDRKWPAWVLETKLCSIRGIGTTVASKLIARKRPRLYPIYDSVVTKVLGTTRSHLVPIHTALVTSPDLRRRLRAARHHAQLPESVSELRVLDVIAWMHGQPSPRR